MSIKTKLLLPTIVTILLVAAATLFSTIMLFSGFVDESTRDRVESASKVAIYNLDFLKTEANAAALLLAENQDIIDAVAANDLDALLSGAKRAQEETDAEFCTVTDAEGRVILRTHSPESGDSALSQATIRSALEGKSLAAIETGGAVRLAVRAGAPIRDGGGAILGAVSTGYRLDTDEFVDSIQAMLECETGIFLGDRRVSTTVRGEDGARAIDTPADPLVSESVLAGRPYTGKADVLGRSAVTRYTPLFGPDEQVVGMLFVGRYVDETAKTIGAFVRSGLVITIAMLALAILTILFIVDRIVTPIRAMTKAASALASGDTDIDVRVNTKDETRTLADAFNAMIENARQQVRIIENIADGGLALPLEARSDKDMVNRALEKLNRIIQAQAAAIREEHDRTKLMLDATPLAARLWGRDFRMVDCNEAAVKLFSLGSKQEYIDRYFELSPERQPDGRTTRDKIRDMISETFEKGACTYEWMYCMLDGTPIPSEVTMVRVPYRDEWVVASYSRDLREYKKMTAAIEERDARLRIANRNLEEALRDAEKANLAKSDFLASMSHEMRTPLNAVIGLSELVLDSGGLSGEAERNMETVYNAGSTLLAIVNNILDISKIEARKFEIIPTEYDVPSMINDAVTQNVLRIGSKPIDLVLSVDAATPSRLYGDELRIKYIINNLLSNAFKYTEKGTVTFEMRCVREAPSAVRVTLRVADTGCGIRNEDMGKLFTDYMRFDPAANRKVDGTGLGLSIVRQLVGMMGGSISAESEYGRGSVFTAEFLQGHVTDAVIGPEVAENLRRFRYSVNKRRMRARLDRIRLPYARVLVVDDNITNLDIAKGLMKPYGMHIDCVTSGGKAVEAIRAGEPRYDAVFMDHMMPEMDGMEAARRIRELGTPYAEKIPIIALTANAIAGNEKMFLENGFQAFISKPIDIARLDEAIRNFVRDKSREQGRDARAGDPGSSPEGEEERAVDIGLLASGGGIAGLDMAGGLARFGDEASFARILRSYSMNTQSLLDSIRTVDAGNLAAYAITVHGIKGSSRNICAASVGDQAEALETAAKSGDIDFVARNNGAFLESAGRLSGDIARMLDALEKGVSRPKKDAPGADVLSRLRAACDACDFDAIDAAMEEIERYDYEADGGLAAWLRESVARMEYESIVERLSVEEAK